VASAALDAASERAYQRCAADLRRVFGDRFVGLVAAGQSAAVAFASAIGPDDLDALGSLAASWRREHVPTPVVITPDEFRRSLDTFPVEYQALIDSHTVIDGVSPLAGVEINRDDLRRACEAQARGHLIHLRQGWIETGAHHHGLGDLICRSAAPLRQLLRNLARLQGETIGDDQALAAFAERMAGMPASLVVAILDLERAPQKSHALVARLPEYLAASERLWAVIDAWRAA
jgi:hypothetical protein